MAFFFNIWSGQIKKSMWHETESALKKIMLGSNYEVLGREQVFQQVLHNPLHESGRERCLDYLKVILWVVQWSVLCREATVETFY